MVVWELERVEHSPLLLASSNWVRCAGCQPNWVCRYSCFYLCMHRICKCVVHCSIVQCSTLCSGRTCIAIARTVNFAFNWFRQLNSIQFTHFFSLLIFCFFFFESFSLLGMQPALFAYSLFKHWAEGATILNFDTQTFYELNDISFYSSFCEELWFIPLLLPNNLSCSNFEFASKRLCIRNGHSVCIRCVCAASVSHSPKTKRIAVRYPSSVVSHLTDMAWSEV